MANEFVIKNGFISQNNSLVNGNLSASTIYSGTTNLYSIFSTQTTNVQGGTNIQTGGTASNPIINLSSSPSINNLTVSGLSTNNIVSANTLSAGTIYSGSTNLYNIFAQLGNEVVSVQPGVNIITGGTQTNPIINLTNSPSVNNFTASGTTNLQNTTTANLTVNGNLFVNGTTFTSDTQTILVSANTITLNYGEANSGVTKGYAGILVDRGTATKYEFAFDEPTQTFRIGQTGNTQPVATRENSPISNGFAYWDNINYRFDTTNSLSASTIYSGNTNLYNIFSTQTTNVQPGSNILTGGTSNNPTISLVGSPSINNLTVSGTSNNNILSATTISANTEYVNRLLVNANTNSIISPERLLVNDGGNGVTGYSNTIVGIASVNNFAQLNIQNTFSGNASSSDIVATADNGSQTTNYIDMGINSSQYNYGYVGYVNDGYLYTVGNNLWIGTVNSGKNIQFFTDGTTSASTRFIISSASTISYVPFSAATLSASTMISGSTNLYNIFDQKGTAFTGWTSSVGNNSIIANNGNSNVANGNYSIATGYHTQTFANNSFSEGYYTTGSTNTGILGNSILSNIYVIVDSSYGDISSQLNSGNGNGMIDDSSFASVYGPMPVQTSTAGLYLKVSSTPSDFNIGDSLTSTSGGAGTIYDVQAGIDIYVNSNSGVFNVGDTLTDTTSSDSVTILSVQSFIQVYNAYQIIPNTVLGFYFYNFGGTLVDNKPLGANAHSEGWYTKAIGNSHSEGQNTVAMGDSHSEGSGTTAMHYSHSEGISTTATQNSHSEGQNTYASFNSHAEGLNTTATSYSHAEGGNTQANGSYSHAEGLNTTANGTATHAEGYKTTANDTYSHAEGQQTSAYNGSHAEGYLTTASGIFSHTQGYQTTALGNYGSHASGSGSTASGQTSFVHGKSSRANGSTTIVLGDNLTGSSNNTVYVNALNVKTTTGTSISYLGITSTGLITTATTASSNTYITGVTYNNQQLTLNQNNNQPSIIVSMVDFTIPFMMGGM